MPATIGFVARDTPIIVGAVPINEEPIFASCLRFYEFSFKYTVVIKENSGVSKRLTAVNLAVVKRFFPANSNGFNFTEPAVLKAQLPIHLTYLFLFRNDSRQQTSISLTNELVFGDGDSVLWLVGATKPLA